MKQIACPVCRDPVDVRPAQGRKSHKPFVMLVCSRDGRHCRGFISDQKYVARLMGAADQAGQGAPRSR